MVVTEAQLDDVEYYEQVSGYRAYQIQFRYGPVTVSLGLSGAELEDDPLLVGIARLRKADFFFGAELADNTADSLTNILLRH